MVVIGLILNPIFLKKELLRAHNMYLLEEENDILFLGSSHVYSTIDTDYLDNTLNANTFLLATPSQNISQSYYLLKEFISEKKPKLVFLETYSLKNNVGGKFAVHAAYDGLKLSTNKIEAAYYSSRTDSVFNTSLFAGILFPTYEYHNRWNGELSEKDFTYFDKANVNKGSEITQVNSKHVKKSKTIHIDYGVSKIKEMDSLEQNTQKSLDKIVSLCEENNIQLVLFSTPFIAHTGFSVEKHTKTLNYLKDLYKSKSIKYLDFNKHYKDLNMSYADFKDGHHLNSQGAKKVNTFLANYVKTSFNDLLPNRLNETLWYKNLVEGEKENVIYTHDLNFQFSDSINFKKITFIEDNNKRYVLIKLNDDVLETSFSNNFRVMIHALPEDPYIKLLPEDRVKHKFDNWDFKPQLITYKSQKLLFTKLKNPDTKISNYKRFNVGYYSSKGKSNVKMLSNIVFEKNKEGSTTKYNVKEKH